MRRSIDFHNPEATRVLETLDGDELPAMSWVVAVSDDYADGTPRVVLTAEEVGQAAYGHTLHLEPTEARRLRAALGAALAEIGEARGE